MVMGCCPCRAPEARSNDEIEGMFATVNSTVACPMFPATSVASTWNQKGTPRPSAGARDAMAKVATQVAFRGGAFVGTCGVSRQVHAARFEVDQLIASNSPKPSSTLSVAVTVV